MKPLSDCRLYTFVDAAYLNGRPAADLARQLCDGGADLIQVRAKGLPLDEIRRLLDAVMPVARDAGVWCVLNDEPELARERGVPWVHLGQEDFFEARALHRVSELWALHEIAAPIPPSPSVGLSSHAPEQALRAVAAGADYVAVGPIFPTGTKPGRAAVTLEYVRWAAAHLTVPWFAIGGIHLGNLAAVFAAGTTRICVVSAILQAPDVAAATREFRRRLDAGH